MCEVNEIHKLSERRDIFTLLVRSICPSIFGHELVKAGLVLTLFGGSDYRRKKLADFSEFQMLRENSHNDEEQNDEET